MKQESHRFHIHLPPDLWEKFKKLAKKNRRTLKQEALIAIERHLSILRSS